jgi:hypothetical protein
MNVRDSAKNLQKPLAGTGRDQPSVGARLRTKGSCAVSSVKPGARQSQHRPHRSAPDYLPARKQHDSAFRLTGVFAEELLH